MLLREVPEACVTNGPLASLLDHRKKPKFFCFFKGTPLSSASTWPQQRTFTDSRRRLNHEVSISCPPKTSKEKNNEDHLSAYNKGREKLYGAQMLINLETKYCPKSDLKNDKKFFRHFNFNFNTNWTKICKILNLTFSMQPILRDEEAHDAVFFFSFLFSFFEFKVKLTSSLIRLSSPTSPNPLTSLLLSLLVTTWPR